MHPPSPLDQSHARTNTVSSRTSIFLFILHVHSVGYLDLVISELLLQVAESLPKKPKLAFIKLIINHLFIAAAPPKAELDSKLIGETVTVVAGSDLVLDGAVGGKPEPTVYWSKGDKILELGEKYSLTYTSTRAMAVIKSCDRYDTGRYILTVKNASGIKTAAVSVKVLGEQQKHIIKMMVI